MPWFQQPFFQVGLPVILAVLFAVWREDKRFKEFKEAVTQQFAAVNKRLDEIIKHLDGIDTLLREHDRDITSLKERTGLVKVK
jgi:hypothetical protein